MTVISVILDGRKKGEQVEVLLSCPSPGEEITDKFPATVALNPGGIYVKEDRKAGEIHFFRREDVCMLTIKLKKDALVGPRDFRLPTRSLAPRSQITLTMGEDGKITLRASHPRWLCKKCLEEKDGQPVLSKHEKYCTGSKNLWTRTTLRWATLEEIEAEEEKKRKSTTGALEKAPAETPEGAPTNVGEKELYKKTPNRTGKRGGCDKKKEKRGP